jgi:hypothetical protein
MEDFTLPSVGARFKRLKRELSKGFSQDSLFLLNRCILKDTKVFESFFNAFGCIYNVLHRIGSVFQCNAMYL